MQQWRPPASESLGPPSSRGARYGVGIHVGVGFHVDVPVRLANGLTLVALAGVLLCLTTPARGDERVEFFEKKVRPVLVEHCYRCHAAESKELQGGLRLDLKAGWELGGDSGQPAIVPGKPDESPLIRAVQHAGGQSAMPPNAAKLPEAVIADLIAWVKSGAVDPRSGQVVRKANKAEWETEYRRRLDWWSLRPIVPVAVPSVDSSGWARTEIDAFILAKLRDDDLQPAPEADRRALVRRLSFALTGLPPTPDQVAAFCSDISPDAYDKLVDSLLDSRHFGERWARHWMDVVHYSDTHGYEWDVPAKGAWRYRDYLIRAFNADLPYPQFVLEQVAGDLLPPRIDPATGTNQALIGPLMLRLGERRHGDNAAIEGVTQEAVANMIDTLGKAFLGTTLACAQCHDHKLDAVEQRDYYSLAGMLLSTRFSARPVDNESPNLTVVETLRGMKRDLRRELARRWLAATDLDQPGGALAALQAVKADEKPSPAFPTSLVEFWKRSLATPVTAEEFTAEHRRRAAANEAHVAPLADFAPGKDTGGWRWEGQGMALGLAEHGDFAVAEAGDQAIRHVLPAGRYSHLWSPRLAGSLQSPQLDPTNPVTFSLEAVSGQYASQSFVVDRALNPERLQFPDRPTPRWQTLTAGNFDSLEGTVDRAPRRVYFELATKSLNNYFPPRVGYGGVKESELADERSWFGVSRIYRHAPGQGPQDDLARFAPLFDAAVTDADWGRRLVQLLRGAVQRWSDNACSAGDVQLLNDALQTKLLPNDFASAPATEQLVKAYRATEARIRPDQTVGSVAEWDEGRDERLAIRGSYVDFGEPVPRGQVRLLSDIVGPDTALDSATSGRLYWARRITDPRNPLLARVYVNRVWHYLFGAGLVRTTDDFGHLGELPSHPELLDYLAARFAAEGWSTKELIRLLVTSAVWRQSSVADLRARELDPENRLWHHLPLRRLEAEEIRDSLLAVSGRLDPTLYGPPIEPHRTAEDSQKRLFRGPIDGLGRRSVYLEMTLMEPPRFLALFNQPLPKQTVGRRDVTNTPDQALALLNDPFVVDMARQWSLALAGDDSADCESRAARMIERALARPADAREVEALVRLVQRSAELRGVAGDLRQHPAIWQDAAHAVFNLKEFLYVP